MCIRDRPYWDWAADGDSLTATQQINNAPLWSHVGGNGQSTDREVVTGPFTYSNFPINIEQSATGTIRATDRGLQRNFGAGVNTLPTSQQTTVALQASIYDEPNYDTASDGFRNRIEGWHDTVGQLGTHNRVHVWIGGDMSPGTSPNDPLFFLNHCNVDRLWAQWQSNNPNTNYLPAGRSTSDVDPLFRHRAGDPLYSILTQEPPVSAMLNVSGFYSYA